MSNDQNENSHKIAKPTTTITTAASSTTAEQLSGRRKEDVFRYLFNAVIAILAIAGLIVTQHDLYRGDKATFLGGYSVGLGFSVILIIFLEIAHRKNLFKNKKVVLGE